MRNVFGRERRELVSVRIQALFIWL
uniref:Uncharacterized protein n=1 Tax=Rhizophora mucronata TaxID=61149 RepID=A0A2P2P4H7_RHIMU